MLTLPRPGIYFSRGGLPGEQRPNGRPSGGSCVTVGPLDLMMSVHVHAFGLISRGLTSVVIAATAAALHGIMRTADASQYSHTARAS